MLLPILPPQLTLIPLLYSHRLSEIRLSSVNETGESVEVSVMSVWLGEVRNWDRRSVWGTLINNGSLEVELLVALLWEVRWLSPSSSTDSHSVTVSTPPPLPQLTAPSQ